MAKFNLGISAKAGLEAGAAEGREAWAGEIPVTGVYEGVLKVMSIGVIGENAKNAGKPKFAIGVELRNTPGGTYDGYIAWGNLNMIDSSLPYINQFLLALTDGSDEQFTLIKKAFYETTPTVDERQKHVLKIGRWNVNSPKGELPITVSLKQRPGYFNPETKQTGQPTASIESYLVNENNSGPSTSTTEIPVEEEAEVELDAEDETEDSEDVEATDDEKLLDA
jgi:hypothetical protein